MNKESQALLLIDSEESWLEFCALTLRDNGYQVYTASTAEAAQSVLADETGKGILLVLVDAKVFELNESMFGALTAADSQSRTSVIVLFPTDLTPDRARRAFKLGAADCVSKPYDKDSLLALVQQMLADCRLMVPPESYFQQGSSNVLIVDDDRDWIESLARYLPKVDQITAAADFETAAQEIEEHTFDLAVIDLRLVDSEDDNFQGMDLIRLLRQKDREQERLTQIIIVSAYGTPEHIRESYSTYNIFYYFDKRYLSPSKYRDSTMEALLHLTDSPGHASPSN